MFDEGGADAWTLSEVTWPFSKVMDMKARGSDEARGTREGVQERLTDAVGRDTEQERLILRIARIKSEIAALRQAALSLEDSESECLWGKIVEIKSELTAVRQQQAIKESLVDAEKQLQLLEARLQSLRKAQMIGRLEAASETRNRVSERVSDIAAASRRQPADFACHLHIPHTIAFVSPLPEPSAEEAPDEEHTEIEPGLTAQISRELSSFSFLDLAVDSHCTSRWQPRFYPPFSLVHEVMQAGDSEDDIDISTVQQNIVVRTAPAPHIQRSAPPPAPAPPIPRPSSAFPRPSSASLPYTAQQSAEREEWFKKLAWRCYRRDGKVVLVASLQLQWPPEALLTRISESTPRPKADSILREPESAAAPESAESEQLLSICCRNRPVSAQFVSLGLLGSFLFDPLAWQCCNTAKDAGWVHYNRDACVLCKRRADAPKVPGTPPRATPPQSRSATPPQSRSLGLTRPERHTSMRV